MPCDCSIEAVRAIANFRSRFSIKAERLRFARLPKVVDFRFGSGTPMRAGHDRSLAACPQAPAGKYPVSKVRQSLKAVRIK